MFSGIVEESATVVRLDAHRDPARLVVRSALDHSGTTLGDSIAISGVCLTVVERHGGELHFDLAAETVRRTVLGELRAGSAVNLERSLQLGSRLHGHLVFGHVDGTAQLISRTPDGQCDRLIWSIPEGLRGYFAPKGSVSISGVSLTVGEVTDTTFSVYIIPHTASVTTLSKLGPGDRVNIEVDMLARYVRQQLRWISSESGAAEGSALSALSIEKLQAYGFADRS